MLHTGDVKNVLISFSLLLYIYCNMLLLDLYNDARSMCLSVKSGGGQGGLITLQSTNWDQWELWPAWRPISFAAFLIPQMIHSLSWDWKSSKKQPNQNDVRNDFLISQLNFKYLVYHKNLIYFYLNKILCECFFALTHN